MLVYNFVNDKFKYVLNIPCTGLYFAVTMLLVAMSTVFTIIVLNIHHKGQKKRSVMQCPSVSISSVIVAFIHTEMLRITLTTNIDITGS